MQVNIIEQQEIVIIGMQAAMSLTADNTSALFRGFMPRKREISDVTNEPLFLIKVYPPNYFSALNLNTSFTKWLGIKNSGLENIPDGFETMIIPAGKYAVFYYKGLNTDHSIFNYIFQDWIPQSGYQLDDRPHFDVLDERYKNNDPESEEEIWIPIK